jgi:hypothetical protein
MSLIFNVLESEEQRHEDSAPRFWLRRRCKDDKQQTLDNEAFICLRSIIPILAGI